MNDTNTDTTKVIDEAPTLATLMAASRPSAATDRATKKATKADRNRLARVNGQKRGRL